MSILKPNRLNHFKRQASILLRDARSGTDGTTQRLRKIPVLRSKTDRWISENIRLKHAFDVIAIENGYPNWVSLRNDIVTNDCLYRSHHVGLIHSWFANYENAERYFMKNGGYLLRFWKDFVVCGPEYIEALSLHHYKNEWAKIAYNLVNPSDPAAGKFLLDKAKENYLKLK